MVDSLRQSKTKEAKAGLAEAIKVLAMLFTNLSCKRKESIGQDLSPSYKQLCLPSHPVTTFLFGDDLQKDIKEIGETYRLGAKTAGYQARGAMRGKPAYRGRGGQGENMHGQASTHGYGQLRAVGAYAKAPYIGRGKSFKRRGQAAGRGQPAPSPAAEAAGSAVSGMPICLARLVNTPDNFQAGKTQQFMKKWYAITSDKHTLDSVRGVRIDFAEAVTQNRPPRTLHFNGEETDKMHTQLQTMLKKGIIEHASHQRGEFISSIFCRPQKDGTVRIILNLKDLNHTVQYHHFKMEN